MSKSKHENIKEETEGNSDLEFSGSRINMKKNQVFESRENIENNGSFNIEAESSLSEKDAIELQRCIDIANKSLENHEFGKSISFLVKVCNIQPSSTHFQLLNNAKDRKEEHERKIREKEELAKKKAEDKRKLDEERQNICRRILKAKNIYEALNIGAEESDKKVKKITREILLKIDPNKISVLNPGDFKAAVQKLNRFKEGFERRIKIKFVEINSQNERENQPLAIEDEKSEESIDEFSNSDDSGWAEEEREFKFEEVQKKKKGKKINFFESQPYQELDDFILNFNQYNLEAPPQIKKISDEFDNFDQYKEEFKAAFFLEVQEIIKKQIKDINKFKVYDFILEEERWGYKVSHSNESVLTKNFYDEIQANDLLLLLPDSGFGFQMSDEILISNYWLGIARKDNKSGSISIKAQQCGNSQLKFNIVSLGNLTTLRREFLIFSKTGDSLLLDYILFPKPPRILSNPIVSERFLNTIKNKFNQSQFEVLYYSFCMNEGISLVQGPPGTGKTSVILGLISGYLSIDRYSRPKILVCAPSNAAIDEIASRAHNNGLFDENGDQLQDIPMLRIGQKRFKNELGIVENVNTKEIPVSVKEISLNYIIEVALNEEGLRDPTNEIKETLIEFDSLRGELEEMAKKGNVKGEKFRNLKWSLSLLEDNLNQLYDEKNRYIERQKSLKKKYIGESDIIFCTSSTAGSLDMLSAFAVDDNGISIRKFDFLIIDEACQSVELNILIPFLYDTSTVILFGDPKQLPATTFADASKTNGYNRSLFERMEDCKFEPLMLKTQYRMISELCEYPATYFYDNKLKSDPSVDRRQMPPGIKNPGLRFFNLVNSIETQASDGHSFYNEYEANYIVYELLRARGLSIGIITPYRAQAEHIKKLLGNRFGDSWRHRIEVDSVDGYQGREKDYIILSLVRSENIGFLSDRRRMNVAITRARFALSILGNARCLRQNNDWDDLIDYYDGKSKLITIDYDPHWGNPRDGVYHYYSDFFERINEEQKINTTIPQAYGNKILEEKKSSNIEKVEAPKLGYKEVSIDVDVTRRRKEERKRIEEAKIPPKATNTNTIAINKQKEERKKAEEAKNIPRVDKQASAKSNTLPKKIPKMTNANIGGGFWNRRK
ncbi:unnamed protein product [Blepharisma stoltei]|uniref:Uncharacterized protein n=1 Tax=Blepharisma stoltei TaxID=1481888 RepID=A0AAU9J3N3_9CILI|nr:unnamed protein product [Blepharisma stoltei]